MQSLRSGARGVQSLSVERRTAATQQPAPLRTRGSRSVVARAVNHSEDNSAVDAVSSRRGVVSAVGLSALAAAFGNALPALAEEVASGSLRGQDVFFDVTIEGEPIGRIVIHLFDDNSSARIAALRFRDLALGKLGVGYRRSRFDGIFDNYLRVESQRSLSYSATAESAIAGGESMEQLEAELASQTRVHDKSGLVSVIVKESIERPVTEKLIARDGKLVTVTMQAGEAPNGTAFMITRAAAPELDETNLIVGEVVSGMDVIETIAKQPFSRPRVEWYDGPFFAAGKAIGDKRAVVAEKGFNRPFKRVVISKTGLA